MKGRSLLLLGAAAGVAWYQNNDIQTTWLSAAFPNLPDAFDGYRILHLSDLHNKLFGTNQQRLIEQMRQTNPDIIVITGDIVDASPMEHALILAERAVKIAPVYYVAGNHEQRYHSYKMIQRHLEKLGVHVLDCEKLMLTRGEEQIALLGMKDTTFFDRQKELAKRLFADQLSGVLEGTQDTFRILLSHRPEILSIYAKAGIDVVFCGHAHGGQIRLPVLGGMMSPGQGAFPRYTGGLYQHRDTVMVLSRGLGNSAFPFRMWNHPELVVMTLHKR